MTSKPISELIKRIKSATVHCFPLLSFLEIQKVSDYIETLEQHCKELREMFDDAENARIETAAELIDANARLAAYDRAAKEPACYATYHGNSLWGIFDNKATAESESQKIGPEMGNVRAFYTAPPLPVVPDEATLESIENLASLRTPSRVTFQWDEGQRNAAADSLNACRAAMLKSGNSEQAKEYPDKLPCDVRLEPGLKIRKGCSISTLHGALQLRSEFVKAQEAKRRKN